MSNKWTKKTETDEAEKLQEDYGFQKSERAQKLLLDREKKKFDPDDRDYDS